MPFHPDSELPGLRTAAFETAVTGCRFSRTGAQVAFTLQDGGVALLTVASGATLSRPVHDGAALCLAPVDDGFATGGEDGRVVLHGPDGNTRELLDCSGQRIAFLATSADGDVLAAALPSRAVLLSLDGKPACLLPETPAPVTALAVSPDGRVLAVGHEDGVTVYAPPRPGARGYVLEGPGANLELAFAPDGSKLASATAARSVRVYDLDRAAGALLEGYPANVRGLSFACDGSILWTGGERAFVGWPMGPIQEGEARRAVVLGEFATGLLGAVAAHPAMPLVAGGVDGATVVLGSPGRQGAAPLVAVPGRRVTGLAWSPDGRLLAGGTDGGGAFCLDLTAKA